MNTGGSRRAALPQGKKGKTKRHGTHADGQAGPHKPDDLRRHDKDSNKLVLVSAMIEPRCNKLMTASLLRHHGKS
jgi:hypothetical protein